MIAYRFASVAVACFIAVLLFGQPAFHVILWVILWVLLVLAIVAVPVAAVALAVLATGWGLKRTPLWRKAARWYGSLAAELLGGPPSNSRGGAS